MFSILNEVLQKLEDGSPKAKLLNDFIIRIFQKKNDKSIVMRCFLRDFVGANDSGRFWIFGLLQCSLSIHYILDG